MPDKRWNIVNGPSPGDVPEGIETLPSQLRARQLCDESFEANLPDDYQILAAQLTADADYLATKYPSPALEASKTIGHERRKSRWRSLTAAALWLIAGAGIGVVVAKQNLPAPQPIAADKAPIEAPAIHTASHDHPAPNARLLPPNPAGIQEVAVSPMSTARPPLDEVKLLQIQIDAFEQVIRKLQDQLARKEAAEAQTAETIESLRQEIAVLRKALDERSQAAK